MPSKRKRIKETKQRYRAKKEKPQAASAPVPSHKRKWRPIEEEFAHMDKTVFSIVSLSDKSDETEYWLSRTPYERLQAVELMRQRVYGYNPTTARLQRVLEIAEFTSR